jgi:hypothetical protein
VPTLLFFGKTTNGCNQKDPHTPRSQIPALGPGSIKTVTQLRSLLTTPQNSVTIFSAIRLFCLTISRAGTYPVFDPSWYAPPIFISSSLEIETAILCASIPIFWPIFKGLRLNKIFVTHEVEVRTEWRNTNIEERELDCRSSNEGSSSTTELARQESEEERYYKDDYVAAWVLPGFEAPGDGKRGHTATVERAEKPLDYLNFELDKR